MTTAGSAAAQTPTPMIWCDFAKGLVDIGESLSFSNNRDHDLLMINRPALVWLIQVFVINPLCYVGSHSVCVVIGRL